jgi:hypothetical protein
LAAESQQWVIPMLNDWRRSGNRFQFVTKLEGGTPPERISMRTPYGLELIENCPPAHIAKSASFAIFLTPPVKSLAGITSSAAYPKAATLFVEG